MGYRRRGYREGARAGGTTEGSHYIKGKKKNSTTQLEEEGIMAFVNWS